MRHTKHVLAGLAETKTNFGYVISVVVAGRYANAKSNSNDVV